MDLITRIRTPELYNRMIASAKATAEGPFQTLFEIDKENLPKLAETYNRLSALSQSDIVCFVHDDIEFMSEGWDRIIQELFIEYDADLIGVVGTSQYEGGRLFDAGTAHGLGRFCCEVKGIPSVKILSKSFRYKPVKVIDGMIMFCKRSFLQKEQFDTTFDQLFFYDADLCLRGKVGVTCNVLVKHSKPKELYGVYPKALKLMDFYQDRFNEKHGFSKERKIGNQICAMVSLSEFKQIGQNQLFDEFTERYQLPCVSAS